MTPNELRDVWTWLPMNHMNDRNVAIIRALADVVEAAKEVAATAPTDVNDLVAALDRVEALKP